MTATSRPEAPRVDFDNHDPALVADAVWDAYRDVRAAGPVTWSDAHGGFWLVTGFAEVQQAIGDHETFSSANGHLIPMIGPTRSIPIDFDPPLHDDYRAIMTPPVARTHTDAMRDVVRAFIEARLAVPDGEVFDGVERLALPLPLMVLRELIGLSPESVEQLRPLTETMWTRVSTQSLGDARRELFELMLEELDRQAGTDSYVGRLLTAHVGGRPIERDEACRVMAMFAIAGHETTLHAVGNLLHDLAGHPGIQQRVREEPRLAPLVVEESLRLRAPAHLFGRTITRDTVLGGVPMRQGDVAMLVYAAANRDPERFADPAAFDPDRPRSPHLSFGWGLHQCIGAPMVRIELRALVEVVSARGTLRPAGEPEWSGLEGGHHMGPRRLPLVFDPAD